MELLKRYRLLFSLYFSFFLTTTSHLYSRDTITVPLGQYGYGELTITAVSPDGTKMLTGSSDGKTRLWDMETGKVIRTFSGHSAYVTSVAFSPDGSKILTGSYDKTARLWDVATGDSLINYIHKKKGDNNKLFI